VNEQKNALVFRVNLRRRQLCPEAMEQAPRDKALWEKEDADAGETDSSQAARDVISTEPEIREQEAALKGKQMKIRTAG
jgi:hypothetical protein